MVSPLLTPRRNVFGSFVGASLMSDVRKYLNDQRAQVCVAHVHEMALSWRKPILRRGEFGSQLVDLSLMCSDSPKSGLVD